MALFHRATITPTKPDLLADWVPKQAWAPSGSLEVIGAFRFDDPEGKVGMETFLVQVDGITLQVPVTYRDAPLDLPEIAKMEHSALGTRWVYDGLQDACYVTMLAGVTLTGQGEALGLVESKGRWLIAPTSVRIQGGGWGVKPVAVDGFSPASPSSVEAVLRNDRFELTVFRRPVAAPRPPIGLTATWDGAPSPVVLAEVREL